MLVGRGAERAQIDGLIAAARAGESGVLVIRGEPGIGKTTLLQYAAERAEGFRMLRAVGVEAESELPFSGIHELLRPVHDSIAALPERQATALRTALALGPPAEIDRFAVYAALLGILAAVADDVPLICLVDDAQWLDTASAEALVFACRRLQAEGIVVLFAAREGEERTFEASGLPELRVTGLHDEAARAVLAQSAANGLPDDVARRLIEVSAGNPLALVELVSLLDEGEHSAMRLLEEPPPVGSMLSEAFLRRARRLSNDAQRSLEVAAASDTGDMAEIGAVMKAHHLPHVALSEAEDARLVRVTAGRIAFRHPLVRAAVYHAAAVDHRRQIHRSLAKAITGSPERRAWHLAAAASEPDESVASALEETARSARRVGGLAAEAAALEWAARLTPEPATRARRLVAAARATRAAGRARDAEAMLDLVVALPLDEHQWAEVQSLRADILYWKGDRAAVARFAGAAAAKVGEHDPAGASALLHVAAMARGPEDLADALSLADRALALAERGGGDVLDIGTTKANCLFRLGRAGEAAQLAARLGAEAIARGEWSSAAEFGLVLAHLERYDEARSLIAQSVSELQDAGALKDLAHALCMQTQLETRLGNLASAYAIGSASLRLAEELAEPLGVAFSASFLAACEALLGHEEEARRHAALALEATRGYEAGRTTLEARAALGILELQLGRHADAIAELERVERPLSAAGVQDPGYVQWAPELVEAYMRDGRAPEAQTLLTTLERQSAMTGRVWAAASAARCRGLLAVGDFDAPFTEALRLHGQTPRPLEEARTRLCYGERLRRVGRRVDARAHLRAALVTFERLGARLWEGRTRAELAASGETIRKAAALGREELTSQELHVALVVSGGATNREAAAQLFLSPKTIEFHLRNAYRKLGVRSRTELANAMRGAVGREAPVLRA